MTVNLSYIKTVLSLAAVFWLWLTGIPISAQSENTPATPAVLRINEFMAANNNLYADEHQDYNDWIEIYNTSAQDINLGGYYFSDSVDKPLMWSIPTEFPEQTVVPAHGFLLLWADDEPDEGPLHLPFKISSSGEVIMFTAADGRTLLDEVEFTKQKEAISYGRSPDAGSTWSFLARPTPGSINTGPAFTSLGKLELYLSYYENRPFVFTVAVMLLLLLLLVWMLFKSKQRLKFMNFEQQQLLNELREKEREHRRLLENMREVIFTLDARGRYIFVSSRIKDLTGFMDNELIGKRMIDFINHNDLTAIQPQIEELLQGKDQIFEFRLLKKDGGFKYVWVSSRPVLKEGKLDIVTCVMLDITERVIAEKKLEEYATYDYLTGIYNRRIGLTILMEKMKTANRTGDVLTICYTDVNDLKMINDTYGHKEGDNALITVVNILKESIRDVDVICRIGGDEFLVIFPSCSQHDAQLIISRIKQSFDRHNAQKVKPYIISSSFGVVEYRPETECTLEEMISLADERMYNDKQKMKVERKDT